MVIEQPGLSFRVLDWMRDSRLGRWLWYQRTLIVYSYGLQASLDDPMSAQVAKDSWAHLERYRKERGQPTRVGFLAMSKRRLDAGEHVYTICEHDRLLAWGWMVPNQRRSWFPAVMQEVCYPERSGVLYGAFTVPTARGLGLNGALVRARLADAVHNYGAEYAFTAIAVGNAAAIRAKKGLELTPWLELGCRVRCGRRQLVRRVVNDVTAEQPLGNQ